MLKPDSKEWNQEALQALFVPRDISLIQSIPLASIPTNDKLFWPFTPSSAYIVKSGYRFLYNAQSLDNGDYQLESNGLWKQVWNLGVQPKVRNSLWRAIKNSIPTKTNLKHRLVITEDCYDHASMTQRTFYMWSGAVLSFHWFGTINPVGTFETLRFSWASRSLLNLSLTKKKIWHSSQPQCGISGMDEMRCKLVLCNTQLNRFYMRFKLSKLPMFVPSLQSLQTNPTKPYNTWTGSHHLGQRLRSTLMGHYLEKKTWQVLDVLSRF